jgi:YD repeat-containing protein
LGTVGTTTYYQPANPIPYRARYDSGTQYFTEQELMAGTTQVYGGVNHPLYGLPIRKTDRNGNELQYHYGNNSSGVPLLRKITGDVAGVTPYFQYANEAIPAPITKLYLADNNTPSASRTIYFQYQNTSDPSLTFMQKITQANGCVTQYGLLDYPTSPGHTVIEKEIDAEGYATYFQYSPSSLNLSKTVEPEGRVTYFCYTSVPGSYLTLLTPQGRPSTYYYYNLINDGAYTPQLNCQLDALRAPTYYYYNGDARVTKGIDARANVTYYQYNSYDSPTQKQTNDGAITPYTYASNGMDVLKATGPRNAVGFSVATYYQYDSNRNPARVTDALGNSFQTGYDSVGHVRKTQDARANTAYFNYDATTGFQVSAVDPANSASYFAYDSWRNVTKSVSPRWKETGSYAGFAAYFAYDQLNRQTKSMDAQGNVAYYDYTSRSDLLAAVNPRNVTTYFHYNGLRLMTQRSVSDATGNQVTSSQYRYNTCKNLTARVDGRGNPTYYFYDAEDQLTRRRDALLNRTYFKSDAVGNMRAVCDARLNTSYFEYDGLNRLKRVFDPLNGRSYFRYDLAGDCTAVENALNNTSYFRHDALDRGIAAVDALSNATYYGYDAVGMCPPRMKIRMHRCWSFGRRDRAARARGNGFKRDAGATGLTSSRKRRNDNAELKINSPASS